MIQPLRIKLHASVAVINQMTANNGDTINDNVPVELIVIDSGEHVGEVTGYIRYLTDPDDLATEHYPWQVCKRINHEDNFTHKQTFKSFEQALHSAMACAYDFVATPIT